MDLENLIPQDVSFKLKELDRPLTLRSLTLDDEVWLKEKFPGDRLQKVFEDVIIPDFLSIIARILDTDSKRYMATVKIVEVNEETGEDINTDKLSIAEKIQKLARAEEILTIIDAYLEMKKRSNEVRDQIEAQYRDQKKRKAEKEKQIG